MCPHSRHLYVAIADFLEHNVVSRLTDNLGYKVSSAQPARSPEFVDYCLSRFIQADNFVFIMVENVCPNRYFLHLDNSSFCPYTGRVEICFAVGDCSRSPGGVFLYERSCFLALLYPLHEQPLIYVERVCSLWTCDRLANGNLFCASPYLSVSALVLIPCSRKISAARAGVTVLII